MQSLALTRPFHSNRVGSGVVPASRLDAIVTNDRIAAQHDPSFTQGRWLVSGRLASLAGRDCVESKALMRASSIWYLAGWGGNDVSSEDDAYLGGWFGARR
jgi:hypothetical protein